MSGFKRTIETLLEEWQAWRTRMDVELASRGMRVASVGGLPALEVVDYARFANPMMEIRTVDGPEFTKSFGEVASEIYAARDPNRTVDVAIGLSRSSEPVEGELELFVAKNRKLPNGTRVRHTKGFSGDDDRTYPPGCEGVVVKYGPDDKPNVEFDFDRSAATFSFDRSELEVVETGTPSYVKEVRDRLVNEAKSFLPIDPRDYLPKSEVYGLDGSESPEIRQIVDTWEKIYEELRSELEAAGILITPIRLDHALTVMMNDEPMRWTSRFDCAGWLGRWAKASLPDLVTGSWAHTFRAIPNALLETADFVAGRKNRLGPVDESIADYKARRDARAAVSEASQAFGGTLAEKTIGKAFETAEEKLARLGFERIPGGDKFGGLVPPELSFKSDREPRTFKSDRDPTIGGCEDDWSQYKLIGLNDLRGMLGRAGIEISNIALEGVLHGSLYRRFRRNTASALAFWAHQHTGTVWTDEMVYARFPSKELAHSASSIQGVKRTREGGFVAADEFTIKSREGTTTFKRSEKPFAPRLIEFSLVDGKIDTVVEIAPGVSKVFRGGSIQWVDAKVRRIDIEAESVSDLPVKS